MQANRKIAISILPIKWIILVMSTSLLQSEQFELINVQVSKWVRNRSSAHYYYNGYSLITADLAAIAVVINVCIHLCSLYMRMLEPYICSLYYSQHNYVNMATPAPVALNIMLECVTSRKRSGQGSPPTAYFVGV